MKSFQKRGHHFQSLQSRPCVHGRCRHIYVKNETKAPVENVNFRVIKQCS